MPETADLIRTKLHPPFTRASLVPRPRLQERIAAGLRRPLTLITAPAGFGKTTLVASDLAGWEVPVAWLSLDRDDNQTGRFLTYLVAALHGADPRIGGEVARRKAERAHVPPDVLLTGLVNEMDRVVEEIILVLDDYHVIKAPAVHEAVTFLLEHCPRTFHLVLVTRSDPPLPLARWRARGQVVELRAADLSFTEAEAARFLNDVMGLDLDAGAVAALEARTEGWIAGLQMAALSMQGREDTEHFVRAFAGTHRFIMDYLLEEVLAREPEEVQRFLLQTSILNRLSAPLCEAVTGTTGGQAMLASMEQRNLFVVPLDDERRWYRYHHLFADLLQARLRYGMSNAGPASAPDTSAEGVARLQSRAAAWCEQHGQIPEAIRYALAARDYEHAGRLIAAYWHQTANNGAIETVWSWLEALPAALVSRSALLSLAYGWVLWLRGRIDAIEPYLVDAEQALRDAEAAAARGPATGAADTAPELPAHLSVLRSIVAGYHGDFEEAVAAAERALRLAPEGLPLSTEAQLHTTIFVALSSAYEGLGDLGEAVEAYAASIHWSRVGANATGIAITYRLVAALRVLGRLREAGAVCRDALAYMAEEGMDRLPAAGVLHVAMSEVLVEQDDLDAADAHLDRGFELGRWSGRLDAGRNAAHVLSRLRLVRGDGPGALKAVEVALAALEEPASPLAKGELLAFKASVLVRLGDTEEAARCAQEATRLVGGYGGSIGAWVTLAASRVKVAQSRPGEAAAHLTSTLAAAEARGWRGVILELLVLRSLALIRQGTAETAYGDLARALALAEPEGYVRLFLDEGAPMQQLLAGWSAQAGGNPRRAYADRLLSRFASESSHTDGVPTSAGAGPSVLIEPLSPRELEVLHLIAAGSTNQAIADQLFIALGTVKAHTGSIYRKLDVANRTEAAARARQLGLLT
jgi:LuxR family maltose regulon positive regulatory protein